MSDLQVKGEVLHGYFTSIGEVLHGYFPGMGVVQNKMLCGCHRLTSGV